MVRNTFFPEIKRKKTSKTSTQFHANQSSSSFWYCAAGSWLIAFPEKNSSTYTHTSMITMGTRFVMPHANCLEIENKKRVKEI